MIDFSCPHCQKKVKVQDAMVGKRIRCPLCQRVQAVPPPSRDAATVPLPNEVHNPRPTVADDVPPTAGSFPDSEDATVPPGTRSLRSPTVTWKAPDAEPADRATREVVKGAFAYEVEGEIARGGMGVVVRAVDQDIHREVAVKLLLNPDNESLKTRFLEEAQITGQLEHPNIVPIHQLGVHADGRCFFSMKMVKGRSLADILKEQGTPGASAAGGDCTLVRLLNIFTNICNALAYAHSRQVIHRDLKPANIMVGDFGEVYVMDWGLAKVLGREAGGRRQEAGVRSQKAAETNTGTRPADQVVTQRTADSNLTQDGAIMGTPAYMPPEQAKGEKGIVDQRSDIYSLGAILYEILTLTPPPGRGGDYLGVLLRVVEGAIEAPAKRAPERARQGWIPAELSAVALKALAKNPDDRYQTVEALQKDIRLYLEGRSVSAKRDTAWELFKKLVKRNKGVSLATAAAVVVLTAVLGVAFYVNYRERVQAETARGQAEMAQRKAEENHQAFLKEQEEKRARTMESAPAFLRAAQSTAAEKQFGDALAQANIALDFDPSLTEGYLLQGQLLLTLQRSPEAVKPLREYVARKPIAATASKLLRLAEQPREGGAYLQDLAKVFEEQKFYAGMGHLNAVVLRDFVGPLKERLPIYQAQIDAGWPGLKLGTRLQITPAGELSLGLPGGDKIRDLGPLKGIPINRLELRSLTKLENLEPLRGMPLTWLNLDGPDGGHRSNIDDLGPLRGMKRLTWLSMAGSQIATLEDLRGMPLEYLRISFCNNITDLEPLRDMPLTEFYCGSYGSTKLSSLEPLTGMKLKKLGLGGARSITDIRPLRDMPLESLDLNGVGDVRDFEPLRGRPLTFLNLSFTRIDKLEVLNGMRLTSLSLWGCQNVKDLTPLAGMPLTDLNLRSTSVRDLTPMANMKLTSLILCDCQQLENCEALKDMPLEGLVLDGCQHLRDLEFVRGMKKLQGLRIGGCNQINDLAPLAGLGLRGIGLTPHFIKKESMEILWNMKSLDSVSVEGRGEFKLAKFRELYEKGEFDKR
jgi:serine/threonine protein kinase